MIVLPATPIRNNHLFTYYADVHFSPEECAQIRNTQDPAGWRDGDILVSGDDGKVGLKVDAGIRSVHQQKLRYDPTTGYPLNKILKLVCEANSLRWHFDLTGLPVDDMPFAMRYTADRRDHYDWHPDIGENSTASRKLSFSLQLSDGGDYEGGDLEFAYQKHDGAPFRKRGTLIIFPSYWAHRVHPVTSGQREVVVGWVHGPSYR